MFEHDLNTSEIIHDFQSESSVLEICSQTDFLAKCGGLLLCPELQSNCVRIEALAHIALTRCTGLSRVSGEYINRVFRKFNNTSCALLEDPSEDVFVSNICSRQGNFLVPEGIWGNGGFYLQRILNVIERMGESKDAQTIKRSVFGILKISNLVCKRASLRRNQIGNETPAQIIPDQLVNNIEVIAQTVVISSDDLKDLQININDLKPFIFTPSPGFEFQSLTNSDLQRCPLLQIEDKLVVCLPTAISFAVRNYIFEVANRTNTLDELANCIANEYSKFMRTFRHFNELPSLDFTFERHEGKLLKQYLIEVEEGRFFHFILYADDLLGIVETGVCGPFRSPSSSIDLISGAIQSAGEHARKQSNFEEAITVIIYCGVGRSAEFPIPDGISSDWDIEVISIPDFEVLSLCDLTNLTTLFQINQVLKKLNSFNATLENSNGLLNLISWVNSQDGHIVPHKQLPDDFGQSEEKSTLFLSSNFLRESRHEIALTIDKHVVRDINNKYTLVRRTGKNCFKEDNSKPFFLAMEQPGLGVFQATNADWWCELDHDSISNVGVASHLWEILEVWTERLARVLDNHFQSRKIKTLRWKVKFLGDYSEISPRVESNASYDTVIKELITTVSQENNTVYITAGEEFKNGLSKPENISESALVRAAIQGFAKLFKYELSNDRLDELHTLIVPNKNARQSHHITARKFRDFVAHRATNKKVFIDKINHASNQLGVGWINDIKEKSKTIFGKKQCLDFLSKVVEKIEQELCDSLIKFNKEATVERLIQNHESLIIEQNVWSRTSGALLALRDNSQQVISEYIEHSSDIIQASLGSRLVAEMALCECRNCAHLVPSDLELGELISKAILVYCYGGMSNAIRWDAMEARIHITPMGNIHFHQGFIDKIVTPAGEAFEIHSIAESIENYEENYEEHRGNPTVENLFEEEFLEAWKEEFNISLNETRCIIDEIENIGMQNESLILSRSEKELKSYFHNKEMNGLFESLQENFVLRSREKWRTVPDEFVDRDRQLWNFRRSLSLVRKPIIELENNGGKRYLLAPGLVRDSFAIIVRNFHRGDIPGNQIRSQKMRSWFGMSANKRGSLFAKEVAEKLEKLGWRFIRKELKVTSLLNKGFSQDYGDIDVLAWNAETQEVLLIECKDVQFKKTLGEIAEQLRDYKGEIKSDGKRDDLKKHLDRVQIIQDNISAVAKYCKLKEPKLKPILLFRNPVPMQFAKDELSKLIQVNIFEDLEKEFIVN